MGSERSSRAVSARRRILIIDAHPLLRRGLAALIDNEPDLRVCAQAATQRAGLAAIASTKPDLVITDLSLETTDGLNLVRKIRSGHGNLPVLVLTMHDAPRYAQSALGAGANGYITKQEMGETLLLAIRRVLDGERFVSQKIRAGLGTG